MTTENATPAEVAPSPYDRRLANEYAAALAAGKEAYEKADEALRRLHNRHQPGFQVQLKDGRSVELLDNFANSNVAWKPAGVRRFDAKIHKPKKSKTKTKPKGKADATQ